MYFSACFCLALGAVSPSENHEVKLQRGSCPMFWYSFRGRCYKYVASRMTWADAELHCVSEGANLVSVHSVEESNFVINLIRNFDPTQGRAWFGLTDIHKEGSWMWSDGCAVDFVMWDLSQPDNNGNAEHCAEINHRPDSRWNDARCSDTFAFVCASRILCPQQQ
ncbi:hypothetical protein LDENG_00253090 [Lucifuga dentata]|nr:hypothetical protein LDENG_00253090 [Lucifuga dentata]